MPASQRQGCWMLPPTRRRLPSGSDSKTVVASPVRCPVREVSIVERVLEVGDQLRAVAIALVELFAVARSTIAERAGDLGPRRARVGHVVAHVVVATVTWFSPSNGTSPVSISKSTTPSESRSDCGVTVWPSACSG